MSTETSTVFSVKIASELGLNAWQVENVLRLLADGASIPFIARYRKELSGSLDEVAIQQIRDRQKSLSELEKRRDAILASVAEQEKLTPELEEKLQKAQSLPELEDLYLPYRQKRKTRASIAMEKGLESLAKIIMAQHEGDILQAAKHYINKKTGVENEEDALAGARDIVAEWVNERLFARQQIRRLFEQESVIKSKVMKGKEESGNNFEQYFNSSELLKRCPSHRLLAMLRGETEGFLRLSIAPPKEKALQKLEEIFVKGRSQASEQVRQAVSDSYSRLLAPSMETEIRALYKEKADKEAIKVFAENVRQLLMSPPLGPKRVLAIDPGFRTGCKVVCLDEQGKLLHNETIYPHPPDNKVKEALNKLETLVELYKIDAIAIGNGTAGRETERVVKFLKLKRPVVSIMVNESGASIYSASAVAREEFGQYDVTVRGSVSIGRRLMDPLAELVKIDPKSIGVGQYQHDVDQKALQESLEEVVISCVNAVGVDVNTASKELLTYVSGLGPVLAKNMVEFRNQNGAFRSREQLKKVPRFGPKAFEQAAGFLRVRNSDNPLDASAVHPESYWVAEAMSAKAGCSIADLIQKREFRKNLNPQDFVTESTGLPTVQDILKELEKPGRDPREKLEYVEFDSGVNSIEDLKSGMELPGVVTNLTRFGAFVDMGVHQDGLIHVSQMADRYISDPAQVLHLNQKVKVRVLEVDIPRKRVSLSLVR
jgi:protein Tex